ncbi:MAG: pimeloyl-ACP methyl ester esterase BioH [Plesiomonas sp.]|uniref:pimeloyl-ACP methyl ester esterase BioH n=1 Tax=Plesiomonas sp. TaxID=2486279 RepID=UPI003F3448C2
MSKLYWQQQGQGERDIVLLHGWGLNAEVWQPLVAELSSHYRVHTVDLPGYGRSSDYGALSLSEMAHILLQQAPANAVWVGWSLGGLVATEAALQAQLATKITAETALSGHGVTIAGLITLASSPCFVMQENWPGIKPEVLAQFRLQLQHDFSRTVERFLALQTLGTATARQDTRYLKQAVLSVPAPAAEVLAKGLDLLADTDLRARVSALMLPALRIYGRLDGLVPHQVIAQVNACWPDSHVEIIAQGAHAPFIAEPARCAQIIDIFCHRSLRA